MRLPALLSSDSGLENVLGKQQADLPVWLGLKINLYSPGLLLSRPG